MNPVSKWLHGRRVTRLAERYGFTVAEVEWVVETYREYSEAFLNLAKSGNRTIANLHEVCVDLGRGLSGRS